jgi:lysophospholipase L1-like esterase
MPYTDTTAVAGTFYWYKLVGVDGLGNPTNSAPVAETGVNTATTTDLSVVAIYYTSILNIVYIGDSITAGGALPTGSITAPTQCSTYLQSMTGIRNVFYANAGVGGFTTTTFLPSVNTSNCFVNAVNDATSLQTANPAGQLVFSIMLGTNDSDTGSDGSPRTAAQLGANLETIIGQLMIDFPAAKGILQTPPLYTANAAVGADYEEAGLARLISYFPEYPVVVAYENSLYPGHMFMGDTTAPAFFAPLYTTEMVIGIGNNGYYYLHPNQQGSNDLARLWANGIYNALFALATTSGRGRTLK